MAITGPAPQTQVDVELRGVLGPLVDAAGDLRARRGVMAMPPTRQPLNLASDTLAVTWADLCERHPDWKGPYWSECRALYAGGERLLGDKPVLERLFPRHMHEAQLVYEARKARAHYYPYAGTIIDHLLAGLGTDPLAVSFSEVDDKGVKKLKPGAEWWERWVTDVTDEAERPADYGLEDADEEDDDEGGRSIHHFLVDALREALQTRTAWVLADLPDVDPSAPAPTSQLDVARSGATDPYLCLIPAESVVDWQTDDRGRLQWAMIMTCEALRPSLRARRTLVRHTYTVWDAESWVRYIVDVDPQKPPTKEATYQPSAGGDHGFGRVPIERLVLPEGMYAMGKLHCLAREHFNTRSAMSYAANRSLFPILYEFLGPEDKTEMPVAAAQMDPNRAVNQIRAIGYTQTRGEGDKAAFVGPDPGPFVAAREASNDAMREMHRVMYSMALSADMGTAAMQRSGESKEQDSTTTAVLLDAFGSILRRWVRRLLVLAGLGRKEAPPRATVTGYEHFDVAGTAARIAEAIEFFNGIPQLSPLVEELALARVYEMFVGDLTQEQRETVRKQIRDGMSAEEVLAEQALGDDGALSPPRATPADDDEDEPAAPRGPREPLKARQTKPKR